MEILEELRALQRDLADLGDAVAVAVLERAEKAFLSWQFDAGGIHGADAQPRRGDAIAA